MKKIIFAMFALMTATFTLTSCEDVPMPYDYPTDGGDDNPGTTDEAKGDGTLADPFNVAGVNQFIAEGTGLDQKVYIKGIVSTTKEISATYGNATFYISDDGTTSATQFYIYRCKGLGGKSITSETEVQVGDTVVVYGTVTNYNGTYETVQNDAYIYSINGKTEGGTDTPDTPKDGYINETFATSFGSFTAHTPKGTAWVIDFSCAKATGYDNTSKTTTPSQSYLVSSPVDLTGATNPVLSFSYILRYVTNYGTAVEGIENKVLVTTNYTGDPTTTTWDDITGTLTEGSDWTTWQTYSHSLEAYKGKQNVVVALYYACDSKSGTWEVKNLTLKEGTGTDTPDTPSTGDADVTMTPSALGLSNAEALTTVTLSDGTTVSFDAGGNTRNKPTYYNSGTNIRMYPQNTMTINAAKNIDKIVIACDTYNDILCNASEAVTTSAGTISFEGSNIVVTGCASGTVTITNASTATGTGSQIRLTKMDISYAK